MLAATFIVTLACNADFKLLFGLCRLGWLFLLQLTLELLKQHKALLLHLKCPHLACADAGVEVAVIVSVALLRVLVYGFASAVKVAVVIDFIGGPV